MTTSYDYAVWTPDTGTTEMPSYRRGVPNADLPTEPMPFWRPIPSVPTTHYTWHALVRIYWARFMASLFVRDVRAYASYAFWPFAIAVGLFVGFYMRDQIVTWHGIETVYGGAQ